MHGDALDLKPESYQRSGKAEREPKLPSLGDPYQAAGLVDSGELSRLVLVMGKDGFKPGGTAYYFLQNVHMGLGEFGFAANGDQVYRIVFSDIQPKLVTLQGRNILRICDLIALRRMPWVRQADRDFRAGDGVATDEPIFTHLEVKDWTRPDFGA